jgi:hypothetical protein
MPAAVTTLNERAKLYLVPQQFGCSPFSGVDFAPDRIIVFTALAAVSRLTGKC